MVLVAPRLRSRKLITRIAISGSPRITEAIRRPLTDASLRKASSSRTVRFSTGSDWREK